VVNNRTNGKISKAHRPAGPWKTSTEMERDNDAPLSKGLRLGRGREHDGDDPFSRSGSPMETKSFDFESEFYHGSITATLLSLGGDRKITRPFLQNPWVYACVRAIGSAVADLDLKVMRKGKDGKDEEIEGHELSKLFEAPNPLHSEKDFLKTLAYHHSLYGETFLLLLKSRTGVDESGNKVSEMAPIEPGQMPEEVWPVRGDLVTEVVSEATKMPIAWRVASGNGSVDYPIHAVVQIAEINPYSMLRGVGPMTAALRDAAKAYTADRYDEALLQNGGKPGGVLSIDGPVSDQQLSAVKKAWAEAHETTAAHGKTAVLPMGTKYNPHAFSPKDMEFGEFREWLRQVIMAVFRVTKPIISVTDEVNYSNAREAYRVFWETSITPLVRFFEDQLNHKFMRKLTGVGDDIRIVLDMSGIEALREDLDSKIDRTLKLYKDGHRSFDEAARLAGWDLGESDPEGAGERWIPNNLVPVDIALEPPPPPPVLQPDQEDGENNKPEPDTDEDEEEPDKAAPSGVFQRVADRAARDAYWKQHDEWLRGHEVAFAKRVERVFRDFLLATRKRLRELATDGRSMPSPLGRAIVTEAEIERLLDLNAEKWSEAIRGAISKPYLAILTEAARRAHGETNGSGLQLQAEDPDFLEFLAKKQVLMVEGPMSNLARSVQRRFVATLAKAPANLATVAEAIAEVLEDLEGDVKTMVGQAGRRAMMIARTETTSAANFSRLKQFKEDGVLSHSWLSSRDAQVRDSHEELDGKVVAVGQDFKPGLKQPGDPNAPVEEIANCRCTTIPELDDSE
jgi:HK97 family phage portal protein